MAIEKKLVVNLSPGKQIIFLKINKNFEFNSRKMRTALLFCYRLKKTAAESHRMLLEAYGDNILSERICRDWFRLFKAGDF